MWQKPSLRYTIYRILYGHYLPTVILTIIWYSITQSLFHSRLKTFLFCKSFPPQPFLFLLQDSLYGFPRLFTVTSEHIRLYFLVFLFYTLSVIVDVDVCILAALLNSYQQPQTKIHTVTNNFLFVNY